MGQNPDFIKELLKNKSKLISIRCDDNIYEGIDFLSSNESLGKLNEFIEGTFRHNINIKNKSKLIHYLIMFAINNNAISKELKEIFDRIIKGDMKWKV